MHKEIVYFMPKDSQKNSSMHSNNVIQLLKILNKQELRKFMAYLKSDYHNENEEVYQLFVYLKKYAPAYQSARLTRASVYKQLFGNQKLNDQKLNKLMYQLKTCLQRFLISYDIDQDPALQNHLLLQALEKRNHPTYAKQSKKVIATITQKAIKEIDTSDYLALFQLNYTLWSNINMEKIGADFLSLEAANENLDKFYFLNKLKILLEYKTGKRIIAGRFDIPQITDLLQLIDSNPYLKDNVTVQLFLQAIQMVESDDTEDYLSLKTAFYASIDQLSQKDARDILVTLNNFYIGRLGKDDTFFAQEGFELSKFADEQALLLEHHRIRDTEYANAALVGFFTGNIDWTAAFIERYKPFLSPQNQEITYAYVKAFFYFQQQDYNGAIELLNFIEKTPNLNVTTDIKTRALKLRAFFSKWEAKNYTSEKGQVLVMSMTNSLERHVVRHKKLAAIRKKDYSAFTAFLRKLITINEANHPLEKLLKLKKQLAIAHPVALRSWLNAKIQVMEDHLSPKEG